MVVYFEAVKVHDCVVTALKKKMKIVNSATQTTDRHRYIYESFVNN